MAGGSRTPGAAAKVRRRARQTLANLSASQNFVAARCAARALAAPRGGSRREMRSQAVRGGIARGATMAECAARGRGAAVVAKAPARAARRAGCFVMRAPCGDVRAQTLHTPPTVVAWCAYNARELGSSCWWYLLYLAPLSSRRRRVGSTLVGALWSRRHPRRQGRLCGAVCALGGCWHGTALDSAACEGTFGWAPLPVANCAAHPLTRLSLCASEGRGGRGGWQDKARLNPELFQAQGARRHGG